MDEVLKKKYLGHMSGAVALFGYLMMGQGKDSCAALVDGRPAKWSFEQASRSALLRELALLNKAARELESGMSEISASLLNDRGNMVFPLMTRLNPADPVLRVEKDNGGVLEFAVTALALSRKDKDAQASWDVTRIQGDGSCQRHGFKLMAKRGKTLRPAGERELEKAREWLDGNMGTFGARQAAAGDFRGFRGRRATKEDRHGGDGGRAGRGCAVEARRR